MLFFSWLPEDQFLVWGWRIPFFLGIIMVAVGLWIRLGILETPVFQKVVEEDRIERAPMLEVIKRQPKQVLRTGAIVRTVLGFMRVTIAGRLPVVSDTLQYTCLDAWLWGYSVSSISRCSTPNRQR